jgi:hypothetical protein
MLRKLLLSGLAVTGLLLAGVQKGSADQLFYCKNPSITNQPLILYTATPTCPPGSTVTSINVGFALPFTGSASVPFGPAFSVTNSSFASNTTGQEVGIAGTGGSTLNSGTSGAGVVGTGGAGGNGSVAGPGVSGQGGSGDNGSAPGTGVSGQGGSGANITKGGAGVVGTGATITQNGDGGDGVVGFGGSNTTQNGNGGNGIVGTGGLGSGPPGFHNGIAGLFNGNVNVTGTLSKAAGSFKIDHPTDPANKFLTHSFVESPDMLDVYNGVAILNNAGEAWITMPDWFEALNSDFRYQLTSIGRPGPNLYIGSEMSGNRFLISGGSPNQKVSWQVTGIRHDVYANAHRIPVEENKPAKERGFYLHPELFGQSIEQSIFWSQRPEMLQKLLADERATH